MNKKYVVYLRDDERRRWTNRLPSPYLRRLDVTQEAKLIALGCIQAPEGRQHTAKQVSCGY